MYQPVFNSGKISKHDRYLYNDNKESFNKRNQRKSINIPDGST